MELIPIAVAGAAGALVKEVAQKGAEWLISLVAAHSPAVKASIQTNAQNFLERLARRVEVLEAELPASQKHVFQDALDHPGSSLLMQKALVSAAVTDNDDRHEILSELIAQRLAAGADDLVALAGAAACDVVGSLSSRHIRLLGVTAVLFGVRPVKAPRVDNQDGYDAYIQHWWNTHLAGLCTPDLMRAHQLDIQHLVGLSCITLSIGTRDLGQMFALPVEPARLTPNLELMKTFDWWPPLKHIWDLGVSNSTPTTTGLLIGALHHDSALKMRTTIKWE